MATIDPPHALDSTKGDFPTSDELGAIKSEIMALIEGVDRAFSRIHMPLVAAYESDDDQVEWTCEQLGVFAMRTDQIVETCEWLFDRTKRLQALRPTIGEVIDNEGHVRDEPPPNEYGHAYLPSPAALERWELRAAAAEALDAR